MPADKLTPQIPGDDAALSSGEASAPDDGSAARVAELEAENAQLRAALGDANSQLQAVQSVPSKPITIEGERLIGENWASMTSAQAKAKGCNKTVLCSDGYYVPGP